ncbi:hypothetical protein D6745_02895 [Candidatus Woesearchaeota archaeon]|nr:MAG: hypothetical protein D6745_02895 [Candidatus Woesearchaeota archaeon]
MIDKKKVKNIFSEIKRDFVILSFLDSIVFAAPFFSVFFLLLMFTPWNVLYSLIPAMIALVYSFVKSYHVDRLRLIEKKYPELNEKLRTARDNINENTVVMQHLNKEVIMYIRRVDLASFVDARRLFTKLVICSVFLFAIVFLSTFNVNAQDIGEKITKPLGIAFGDDFFGDMPEPNKTDDQLILGKPSIATLGNKKLDLRINVMESAIDITNVKESKVEDFEENYPNEVDVYAQELSEEKALSDIQRDVVKNYFSSIHKESTLKKIK